MSQTAHSDAEAPREATSSTWAWWPALVALVFTLLTFADVSAGGWSFARAAWSAGLGGAAGLALGLGTGALALLGRGRPALVSALTWALVGGALAFNLASELGVLARLGGEHKLQAFAALGLCTGLVVFAALLGPLVAPSRAWPDGWIRARSRSLQLALAGALLVVAVGASFVDRTVEPDAYPAAHDALRLLVGLLGALALYVGAPLAASSRLRLVALGTLAACFIGGTVTAFTLTPSATSDLAAIQARPSGAFAMKFARWTVDADHDGYASLFGGRDCRPFDGDVNPGAAEIPGNGIDDNCLRGDARKLDVDPLDVPVPSEPSPASVVLITIDTISAPHMGLYGAKEKNSPRLRAWAGEQAVVFERAYTSGGWTSLAMSSLFRGLYPRRLQWTRLLESDKYNLYRVGAPVPPPEVIKTAFGLPLEDPRPPLAWWLQRRGMYTVAVANDRQSEFLDPEFAGEGFDRFVDIDTIKGRRGSTDADVTDAAIAELERLPDEGEFFMWVHYFGPHRPSQRHEGIPDFGNSIRGRYAHELAFNDQQVARLLDALAADPATADAAVIITSDHGERVRKKKRGHGRNVREEEIRIPLLLKAPGLAAGSSKSIASLVDVMPTILAITNTPGPPSDGTDLREVAAGNVDERIMLSETWRFNARGEIILDITGVFDGRRKLVFDHRSETQTLRRQKVPDKNKNVLENEDAPALREALEAYLEENGPVRIVD